MDRWRREEGDERQFRRGKRNERDWDEGEYRRARRWDEGDYGRARLWDEGDYRGGPSRSLNVTPRIRSHELPYKTDPYLVRLLSMMHARIHFV